MDISPSPEPDYYLRFKNDLDPLIVTQEVLRLQGKRNPSPQAINCEVAHVLGTPDFTYSELHMESEALRRIRDVCANDHKLKMTSCYTYTGGSCNCGDPVNGCDAKYDCPGKCFLNSTIDQNDINDMCSIYTTEDACNDNSECEWDSNPRGDCCGNGNSCILGEQNNFYCECNSCDYHAPNCDQ